MSTKQWPKSVERFWQAHLECANPTMRILRRAEWEEMLEEVWQAGWKEVGNENEED